MAGEGPGTEYGTQVFLNVSFDSAYLKLSRALVFGVHCCGMTARCALESSDGGEIRLDKIYRLIQDCRYGIHDLSRTSLDRSTRLPRFNMPLELGIFLGARRFGSAKQRAKVCLILDHRPYRYQKFCSDIAGQDIRVHSRNAVTSLGVVRNWLQAALPRVTLPGPKTIEGKYLRFQRTLPKICTERGLTPRDLSFLDYRLLVQEWLELT